MEQTHAITVVNYLRTLQDLGVPWELIKLLVCDFSNGRLNGCYGFEVPPSIHSNQYVTRDELVELIRAVSE